MNGWYPRLSLDGRVASGFGEVWYEGRIILNPGYKPLWFDHDHIVAGGEHDWLYLVNVHTGQTAVLTQSIPWHVYAAGAGRWAVAQELHSGTRDIALDFDPVTGRLAHLLEHGGQNTDRSLYLDDQAIVEHRFLGEMRAFDGMVVWTEYTGHDPADRGIKGFDRNGPIRDLRVTPLGTWQGKPVPVRTSEGPWLVFATNLDLRLHPWGGTRGYVIRTGEDFNFNHDAIGMGNTIRVVWQDKFGVFYSQDVSLSAPREDVTFGITTPPPPEPEPGPEPEPEPEPDVPESIEHLIQAERDKYPAVVSFEDGAQMINDACWIAGLSWGLSAKPNGNNVTGPSGDKVAYDIAQHRDSDTLWDCFQGQETGEPFRAIVIWNQAHPHNDPNRPWVAPVPPEDGGGGPGPEPIPPDAETVEVPTVMGVQNLINEATDPLVVLMADLEARVIALESQGPSPTGLQRGDTVGLRSARTGKLLCNDDNRPEGHEIQADDREGQGEWESWKIE